MTAGNPTALKERIRDLIMDSFVWDSLRRFGDARAMAAWQKAGKPVPPPHATKESIVATYASTFGIDTLIETGTYLGEMVYAMRNRFRAIYSIELSRDLARRAQHRFRNRPKIQIMQGDSGEVLPRILGAVATPSLFWLDGHYSAGMTAKGDIETPVMAEVRTILAHPVRGHVVLIDDARCFDGTQDYPTIDELRELFRRERPDYKLTVSNDVIRVHPERPVESEF